MYVRCLNKINIVFCVLISSTACIKNHSDNDSQIYPLYLSSRLDAAVTDFVMTIETVNIDLTIRSAGGDAEAGSQLGVILSSKNTSVTIHDFCHSACAEFIVPAANEITFLNKPLVGFHWSPIMDYNQFSRLEVDMSSCDFSTLENQIIVSEKNKLSLNFWAETEKRLNLIKFEPINMGETCPRKRRQFENDFWLPNSQQFADLWGLEFSGKLCADSFDECKTKIDLHWSKGKRIVVGDEVYTSRGRH